MLSVITCPIMLSVIYAECHNLPNHAKCRFAECRYAECRGAQSKLFKIPTNLNPHDLPL